MSWSKSFVCCTVCGGTDSPHASRGMCDRCRNRIKYQTDPKVRARILQRKREWQLRQPDYGARYSSADREAARRYCRNYHRLRRAAGFQEGFWRGQMVTAAFLPKPGRLVRRYVQDDEVVADVQVGMTVHEAVPLASLRRVGA